MVNMVQGIEKKREKDLRAQAEAHDAQLAALNATIAEKTKQISSHEAAAAKREREYKEVLSSIPPSRAAC
jgi:hypothetical protein